MRPFGFALAASFALLGCTGGVAPHDGDGGNDLGTGDLGATGDAGAGVDSGATVDSGPPACVPPSTGPTFTGCNPTDGIQCDGNWVGTNTHTGHEYCTPACTAAQCCAPQHGTFACVARDAAGHCPAADLFPDMARIVGNYAVEYRDFAPASCAIVEGTLGGAGMRRLLRFDTWTPNQGTADMFLGVPDTTSGRFTYSACHMHYHFNSYAAYELLTSDGHCVVATGHKQAFCLEDFYHWPGEGDRSNPQYDCSYQGIEMGWQDVYARIYDGQWIDVTGVPPGNYILRVRINTEHLLAESNYDNNQIDVPVTITTDPGPPPVDITAACPAGTTGTDRTCGFVHSYDGSCAPGTSVTVGCSASCGFGSCTGDTVLRVCDTAVGVLCDAGIAIVQNDDSGCGTGTPPPACGAAGGDCCSRATFTCPSGAAYTVWTGAYDAGRAGVACNVAVGP